MNQMIENNIREYPGDNGTVAEFHNSIRCMFDKQKRFSKKFFFFSKL